MIAIYRIFGDILRKVIEIFPQQGAHFRSFRDDKTFKIDENFPAQ